MVSQVLFSAMNRSCKAAVKSKAVDGRILWVDGFSISAADTPENNGEYPKHPGQAEGLGFPMLRCVSLISMTTGMLVDLASGPYRDIKSSLGMHVICAKTPEMVRTELWTCLLAYTLIRLKMLQSCADSGRDPGSLRFTTSLHMLGTSWLTCAAVGLTEEPWTLGQAVPTSPRVGHRSGRVEPRKTNRRPKLLALLTKPTHQGRAELGAAA